jgi:uncharacterized protein (TIGR00730 family)
MITLSFKRSNGPIDGLIDGLMDETATVNRRFVREMVIASLKTADNTCTADLKMINTTLKDMRFTSKVFGPYKGIRKITAFGSARTQKDSPVYKLAINFGKRAAEASMMVITGAGPGIMQAVNEGAGPEMSFGVGIQLPFETPNAILSNDPKFFQYKYFFTRKVAFLKECLAVAIFPGGVGTLDEAMETVTLLQTGKCDLVPVVLIDQPGGTYWSRFEEFLKEELLQNGYISPSDFSLFERVDSASDAIEKINQFYRRFHSIRYVGSKTVIRMTSRIGQEAIDIFKKEFADIITTAGTIALSGPLPEEFDESETLNLPRLVVDFNRHDFGRLRQLVNKINMLD